MKLLNLCKLGVPVAALLAVAGRVLAADPPPGTNAPPATLEALVADVVGRNPELNFYRAAIAAAKGERRTAAAWANPELSTTLGQKSVRGGGLSDEGVAWSVGLQQPIEWPGRIPLRKAIAKWRAESVEEFRSAAELADRHYRLGAVPIATYVELQKQYLEAVEALLDTKREALEAGQEIQRLTGLDFNAVSVKEDAR
jgi:outer membrane protein TolC